MGSIEIFKLFGSILVDNDEANKSISKTGKESDGLASKMGRGIKTAGKWALGITTAAIGIGAAAFAMTKKVTAGFDDIAKNSRKMGVTTDYYQEMEYWASQNGLSHENMEKSMKRLNQRLGQAVEGNEKYSNALTRLGVDLREVEKGNITTEQAMTQSIQALSQMENSQEKAALASELFGTKLSQELMPAIDGGALSIEDAQKKAEELGIVIGEDTLNAAEKFNDSWDDMTRALGAFGQKVLAELMPVFQSMMDWVLAHMPQIQAVFQTVFDVIGTIFNTAVGWIQSLIAWLGEWFSLTDGTLTGIWEAFQLYLGFIIEYWKMIFENIKVVITETFNYIMPFIMEILTNIYNFWQENGAQMLESALGVFNSIRSVVETVFGEIWEIIQVILGLVMPFVQESLNVLFGFWEENGQQIMQAVENAFNFIKSIIDFIMPAILFVIKMVWGNIKGVINGALNIIMGIVKVFSGLFTGDWSKMWEGVKQLLKGALEFIWNFINLTLIGRGLKLITSFWKLGVNIFKNMGTGIINIFRNMGTSVMGAIRGLLSKVTGAFKGLGKTAFDWGKNMIKGFVDGIKNMGKAVADAASGVVKKAAGFLKFWSPAKEGEGRFITNWGENMIDGFLDGVRNETGEAGKVMNDLIESMSPNALDFNAVARSGVNNTSNQSESATSGQNSNIVINPAPVYLNGEQIAEILFDHIDELNFNGIQIKTLFEGGDV